MKWRVAGLVLLQLIGTSLFIVGFFPQRIAQQTVDDADRIQNSTPGQLPSNRSIDRLVVMIIDAFSYDFLTSPEYVNDMPSLHTSIKNSESVVFKAHVQAPTVTLPRIKAVVSGTIPTYMDVVFNFASSSFDEDNWLTSAIRGGYRILFYGDDTWLNMFPEGVFMNRSEGTSSFFVKDYTEVDTNITRHLPREFSEGLESWDILLLHYLGLDHIGHSLGGRDPQLHVKLQEMDDVISGIWSNMTKNVNENERIWFVLMGDHGMTFAGGHGGSSERESYVPVIVRTNVPQKYMRHTVEEIEQVDLVPTISFMLNLSLPTKSVGVGFEKRFIDNPQRLNDNLEHNSQQFHQLALSNRGLFSALALDDLKQCKTIRTSTDYTRCTSVLKAAQLSFLSSNENLDMNYIVSGVILSAITTFFLLNWSLKDQFKNLNFHWIVFLHPIFLFSSSYIEEEHDLWYFMLATVLFYELYVTFWNLKTQNIDFKQAEMLVVALVLHRIARYPSEVHRRRWVLDDEFGILNLDYVLKETTYLWTAGSILVLLRYFPTKMIWTRNRISNFIFVSMAALVFVVKLQHLRHNFLAHFAVVLTFVFGNWNCGFLVWQLLVLNPSHYLIALICQTIGACLGQLNRTDKIGRSALMFAAVSASFFYAGGSNSLDTIDVATGYAGLTNYYPFVVGVQMLLNAYMGPLNVIIGWKHTNKSNIDVHLFINIVALRSAALLCTTINLFHQRSHLFNWRVFAPKILVEGLHFITVSVWILIECIYLLCDRYIKLN
ncbi:hypothetical protein M3Y94_01139700 [Aphelenchoides besseyi]|nr:hypothetical protein M3Y94_01139700 [Aphelenchoides besseyi]KAI6227854.1 hypothetical protein M3Y95_00560400 [Aphelenchoides besseyi]